MENESKNYRNWKGEKIETEAERETDRQTDRESEREDWKAQKL